MSEDLDVTPPAEAAKPSCCLLRQKIMVGVLAVLPEEKCGVSDVELLDVSDFEAIPGKTLIRFRYCAWCGTRITPQHRTRTVMPPFSEFASSEDDEGEEWKKGVDDGLPE